MLRVPVAVRQGDRRRDDPPGKKRRRVPVGRFFVQRSQDGAVGRQPLVDLDDLLVQRLRSPDIEREQVGALLGADAQEVAEPARDEQRRRRSLTGQERVRAKRRRQPQRQFWKGAPGQCARQETGREDRRLVRRDHLERRALRRGDVRRPRQIEP